jgi:hypothetical protein
VASGYQGISLCQPFLCLLEDSVLGSSLSAGAGCEADPVVLADEVFVVEFALVFALELSAVEGAAPVAGRPDAFTGGGDGRADSVPPVVAVGTLELFAGAVASPTGTPVPGALPGTVSTETPLVPAPTDVPELPAAIAPGSCVPGCRTSVAETSSPDGVKFGCPLRAALDRSGAECSTLVA